MDTNQDELNFEAIMREFHDPSTDVPAEEPAQETPPETPAEQAENVQAAPAEAGAPAPAPEAPAPAEPDTAASAEPTASDESTVRIDDLSAATGERTEPVTPTDDRTQVVDIKEVTGMEELKVGRPTGVPSTDTPPAESTPEPAPESTTEPASEPTTEPASRPMTAKEHFQEIKRKLIEGPEKRFYELSESGLGKLQTGIIINLVVVLLCGASAVAYALDMVPDNRIRLLAFAQVLAMLVSALFGSNQLIDGLGEIFHGRFTINTLLAFTFAACCVDAVLCLRDLRIPCCAAFSLEMTMALWGRYERRHTEMYRMDTMRKAGTLHSIVRSPDYYNNRAAFLRGDGDPDDFLDAYKLPTGPERAQSVYAFVSFIACLGIATIAGLLHGKTFAAQVLSTSLLLAVPASSFVTLTRPEALLERRLHMVGSVICGWQGVRKLCGKAVLPIKDEDLFPGKTTKLNGVKFYGSRDPNEIVTLTTSLIVYAGGGLVDVFRTLLSARGGMVRAVDEFRDYGNGGIGGIIGGETVLLGTLDFMQDMDIDVPEGTTVSQAVYAAIGGELSAVVAISYAKMRSSAAGLVSLTSCRRLTPIVLTRDFMLTEPFLRGKFSVSTRRMVFPTQEVRDELLAVEADPEADVLALTTRDDLASYVYAITGASALRTASRLGLFIHLLGGVLGMLIMAALAYLGSTDLLTPINILLYQLIWMIPGLLVTEWTRTV